MPPSLCQPTPSCMSSRYGMPSAILYAVQYTDNLESRPGEVLATQSRSTHLVLSWATPTRICPHSLAKGTCDCCDTFAPRLRPRSSACRCDAEAVRGRPHRNRTHPNQRLPDMKLTVTLLADRRYDQLSEEPQGARGTALEQI